ncbi:hypothetical protein HO173_001846 [Letharia columbiana]|uniref:N-acetyltransferase domain-containing protein n=1 Tax=Letharia columbiana TaxID=112416 RepID=A0A8H6G4G7_9LECA|nr:uncharacterized protein HO173_001846 [Letharia columbiana]KAF6240235.1 hypothetical protein HO173_001846 [Letharia columbiana]
MPRGTESGGDSPAELDFTELDELFIMTREAERGDVGAMANIFIKSFKDDKTAQLLYPHDEIWPVVVEMLRNYLDDDYTHVIVAEDRYTDTTVGWTSVSLVASDQEDHFKFCDSTVWAGRRLLHLGRSEGPLHVDEVRRAGLITQLSRRNRDGQKREIDGQHLVINTFAIHPDVFEEEIPEIAYKLMDDTRDLAKGEGLPLWAQLPQNSLGNLEELFQEIGFAEVGSFELNLTGYTNEEHRRRRRNWGWQKWTQWVLKIGNWECGRRY